MLIFAESTYNERAGLAGDHRWKVNKEMGFIGLLIFMALIGAAIGAVTNAIAIKMLFRPYNSIYIGKWKFPFTPGLIPKRRGELAQQIGRIVEEHLLTPASLEKKLQEPAFRQEVKSMLQQEVKPLLASEKTVSSLLKDLHFSQPGKRAEEWVEKWIDDKYDHIKGFYLHQTVRESLPAEWLDALEGKVPDVSSYILQKSSDYFSSMEGKWRIKRMADDFLFERGKLGSMLQMILGNTSLEDKIQPEILKFINNPGTKELLDSVLMQEWEKLLDRKWEDIFEYVPEEQALSKLKQFVLHQLNIPALLERPVADFLQPLEGKIIDEIIPSVVDHAGEAAISRVPVIMKKLGIGEIVRNQVETFSLQRLEQIVLDISRRELKMITFLGGLLGGGIGLVQAVIVHFIG